jgi:hypothetical protein
MRLVLDRRRMTKEKVSPENIRIFVGGWTLYLRRVRSEWRINRTYEHIQSEVTSILEFILESHVLYRTIFHFLSCQILDSLTTCHSLDSLES